MVTEQQTKGQVVSVVQPIGTKALTHQSILCKVDPTNFAKFIPLNSSYPPIYAWVPEVRKKMLKVSKYIYTYVLVL